MKNEPLHNLLVAAGLAALVLAFAGSVHAEEDTQAGLTKAPTNADAGTSSSAVPASGGVVKL